MYKDLRTLTRRIQDKYSDSRFMTIKVQLLTRSLTEWLDDSMNWSDWEEEMISPSNMSSL